MLNNLRNVLYSKGIRTKTFADYLGVSEKTAENKIKEITAFTYPEFKKVCSLLPEYNADYIFKSDTRQ